MSYEPLHHKYRPQTFADLVGQDAIATTLTNAIRTARIARAYLFTGSRGTGKTSSARILAKCLNCLKSDVPTPTPCGVCEVCKGIANGSALDVIEIDAASNTGVDNIRELIERAQFAPVQCRYKVYVIDECLTGDSLVQTSEGLIRIDNPNIKAKKVLSYNDSSGAWEFKKVVRWLDQGERQTLVIKTTNREIRCTGNHLIRTETGWIPAKDVEEGAKILSPANVDAEPSFTNSGQMDAPENLLEDTSLKAIHTGKKHTTWTLFWNRLKLSDPFALVDVENDLISPHFYRTKVEGLRAFSLTGKDIHTKKHTEFGKLEQKSSLPPLKLCNQKRLDSSMELCLEIAPSLTQTNPADSLDYVGHTHRSSRNGWNIKPLAFKNCDQSYELHLTRDTEIYRSVATHPVIPNSKMSLTSLNQMGIENSLLWTGSIKLLQKDLPGGTWTMGHSASVQKEVHRFNFIQKDTLLKKIKSLPTGSQQLVIQQLQSFTEGVVQAKHTITYRWAQIAREFGWQTSNTIRSPQWITNLERVESVKVAGVERVYDIEVEENHNFVANGLCLHNCHMLSTAAFNALLKTLEEPPERVVFVLATTDEQRVLPTIISRCQRFDFRRIAIDAMVTHLKAIASLENINITQEALLLIASFAQGGLRDAESLLDQLSLLSGQVTVERVWDLVGSCSEPDLIQLLQAITQNNPESVLDCARRIMDRGREPLTILQNLAGFYRDLLIALTAPSRSDLVTVTPSTWKALCEQAVLYDLPSILAGQQHLAKSEVQLKNTTQPRLWLEVTLLGLLPAANKQTSKLSAPSSQSEGNGVTSATQSLERSENGNSTLAQHQPPQQTAPVNFLNVNNTVANNQALTQSAPQTPSQPPLADPHPPNQDISSEPLATAALPSASQPSTIDFSQSGEQIWEQVLANLQPISTRELLRQLCHLIQFDGDVARIGIASQAWYKKAQAHLPNITAAFQATFKHEVQVSLELATQTKSASVDSSATSKGITPTSPQITEPRTNNFAAIPTFPAKALTSVQSAITPQKSDPSISAPKLDMMTPTPIKPVQWQDDEVLIAAQRCAEFFNGELVEFNLDSAFPQATTNSSPLASATPITELSVAAEDTDIEF